MRQVDNKTNVIRKCDTSTNPLFVMEQACSNPQTDSPGPPSCWRHVDNLPINQLGFPLHFVKIFDGGACLDTHGNLFLRCGALLWQTYCTSSSILRYCRRHRASMRSVSA